MKLARNALHLMTALAISAATTVSAAPVTLNFAGSLTSSFGSLNSGDPFSGSYTFDPLVAATGTSSFAVFNDLLGATLSTGSFSATIGPGTGLPELQQDNVAGADRYALVGRNPVGSAPIGGLNILAFGFRLDDTTGTAISDALTLLNSPSLASFTSNTFLIFFGSSFADPSFQSVSGTLDRLGPAAVVPEPGTLALLLAGLVVVPLARKRARTAG